MDTARRRIDDHAILRIQRNFYIVEEQMPTGDARKRLCQHGERDALPRHGRE